MDTKDLDRRARGRARDRAEKIQGGELADETPPVREVDRRARERARERVDDLLAGERATAEAAVKKRAAARSTAGGRSSTSDGPDATDAARELAAEHGVDLGAVTGTGEGGRILLGDVLGAIQPRATDAAAELAAGEGIDLEELTGSGDGGRIVVGDVEAAIEKRDVRDAAPTD